MDSPDSSIYAPNILNMAWNGFNVNQEKYKIYSINKLILLTYDSIIFCSMQLGKLNKL